MKVTETSFSYGELEIFQSASIEFEPGVNLIMGPSGCGKTTLLKVLSGFFKGARCHFNESFDSKLLVLQEDALIPWLSGWDNLLFFLKNKEISHDYVRRDRLFPLIELFIEKKAWQMSFGQRRSIELVRAIMQKPCLLLLDEPLNFIDPDRRRIFADVLFNDNKSKFTLVTTHESSDFSRRVDHSLNFDGQFPIKRLLKHSL